MTKNKNNRSVWNERIKKTKSSIFDKVGSSLEIDKKLYKEDIKVSLAHTEMLYKQNIINFKIKNKIIFGLNKIKNEITKKKFVFKKSDEDIHMSIERRLFELINEDAGYLHTARSRNDQVITDFKIWLKIHTEQIIIMLKNSKKLILKIAEKNIYTIMPGFTHLKHAQPISFAHYILAYIEMFDRDITRFQNNLNNLLENPMGVGALSGTSFNIDRKFTTKKLKFKSETKNSIDTVSDRDFVLDFLYSTSLCSMHISRLAEEFIIWNSDAFNLIKINDKVVTGSSIMPQKKNPDPLEFLRGQTGSSYGNLFSMLTILKGLPLSYFKDLQDDKRIVFQSHEIILNSILVLNEFLKNFSVNKKRMNELAKMGYLTATDLAEFIVKELNYPFRKAYNITAKIVNLCEKRKKKFTDLNISEIKKIEPKINKDVFEIFDLYSSVSSKKSYGGTSFENIKKMIKIYKSDK